MGLPLALRTNRSRVAPYTVNLWASQFECAQHYYKRFALDDTKIGVHHEYHLVLGKNL